MEAKHVLQEQTSGLDGSRVFARSNEVSEANGGVDDCQNGVERDCR
jgi:hypothetical protein